jgi:pimeloyl-ACP methyl ester carboxylesterase
VSDRPGWAQTALATPYEDGAITVEGADVHYLDWGGRGLPGLLFVHGGAAHAHWWTHLAPLFTRWYHPVAVDLTGHGDSGRRERYSHDLWATEILGVSDAVGFPGPPVVVGHSLGGIATIQTAATYGDSLAGAVIVDSPVRRPDPESEEGSRGGAFRAPGVYPTLEEAIGHFHLVPRQPDADPWVMEHVARHSLHETPDGWTWKFDPRLFGHTLVNMNDQLANVKCRVALLRGELSVVVPDDTASYMYELMGRVSPVISIPEAHHHLILDQPLSFVAALRALLADWEHSVPYSREGDLRGRTAE